MSSPLSNHGPSSIPTQPEARHPSLFHSLAEFRGDRADGKSTANGALLCMFKWFYGDLSFKLYVDVCGILSSSAFPRQTCRPCEVHILSGHHGKIAPHPLQTVSVLQHCATVFQISCRVSAAFQLRCTCVGGLCRTGPRCPQ
jgi:hypothetical protein